MPPQVPLQHTMITISGGSSSGEIRQAFLDLHTPRDLATMLGVSYSQLVWHIYRSDPTTRYQTFFVRKRSGGVRRISAPASALKLIQRSLNGVLQHVYRPRPSVHGFVQNRNILTNARQHVGRRHVLNIDLADFFESINFGRVRGMFMAKPYGLDPSVATVLAQICCHDNHLPQGAPTSPIVANMICMKMDGELQRMAKEHRVWYSRYADDLTFSTSVDPFPSALAIRPSDAGDATVGRLLSEVIASNGFDINLNKVRLQDRNFRQSVTGLTVNERPNVRRKFIRAIRGMIHAWQRYGLEAATSDFHNLHDKKHRFDAKGEPTFRAVLRGRLSFLKMVKDNPDDSVYRNYMRRFRSIERNTFH